MCIIRKIRESNRQKKKAKQLKQHNVAVEESIVDVKQNYIKAKTLLNMAQEEELITVLETIVHDLEYAPPAKGESVAKYDKKICNALDDLKVAIASNKHQDKINALAVDLSVLIAERNEYASVGLGN